jgi:hypothetical protein
VWVVVIFHVIADPYLLSDKLVTEEMSQSEIGPYVDAALTGSATQATAAVLMLPVVSSVTGILKGGYRRGCKASRVYGVERVLRLNLCSGQGKIVGKEESREGGVSRGPERREGWREGRKEGYERKKGKNKGRRQCLQSIHYLLTYHY